MKKRYYIYVLIGAAFSIGAVAFVVSRPMLDSDPVAHRAMVTNANLLVVGETIEFWIKKHKRAPSNEENFSVLGMKTNTPPDGWERPLVYKYLEGPRQFLLYSLGPNGVDEHGAGDDIVFRRE